MTGTTTGAVLAGALSALVLTGSASGGEPMRLAAGEEIGSGQTARVFRTKPSGEALTREERERSYRSCLFTYLPRIGSDAAAEMIRDACREEFLDER